MTKSAATLIPPAFGMLGLNMHTWTGWGFVANTQMHGNGTFYDPRLEDAGRFPVAAANDFGNVRAATDPITAKGGFYHDGRFPTLAAVVDHYDANMPPPLGPLTLTATEKAELVEFLKSL